jgi:MFS family permease
MDVRPSHITPFSGPANQAQDDGSLFNGLQTIDEWQEYFGHPSGNLLGLMNSAALFPGLIMPYFAEKIADRFGRRWAVWGGVVFNVQHYQ